ncbi:MAG: hypothetical protein CMH54_07510 [Myxococcales bacterium]|nr:hypothetical protein [Myxococcales bacterium]
MENNVGENNVPMNADSSEIKSSNSLEKDELSLPPGRDETTVLVQDNEGSSRTPNLEEITAEEMSSVLDPKIRLVTLLRVLLVSVVVALTLMLPDQHSEDGSPLARSTSAVYLLAMVVYCASALYLWVLVRYHGSRSRIGLIWTQIGIDLVFSLGLTLHTGGTESIFSFFFSLAVINSAILLYRRGSLVVACLSTVFFGIVAFIETNPSIHEMVATNWLIPTNLYQHAATRTTIQNLGMHAIAFFAIAFLASYLSEQLRAAGETLQAQKSTILNLEDLLNSIISSIPIGVIVVEGSGSISFMNNEALGICGTDLPDVLGKPVANLFPDLRHIRANRDKAGRVANEITSQVMGREIRLLRWTITPLKGTHDGSNDELLIFEDITSLVALQREMQESRQLVRVGKLAAGVAHEIRNPLGAISGCAQLLKSDQYGGTPSPEQDRLMNIIMRETDQLNTWIGEFLAYARPKPPDLEDIDLLQAVRDSIAVLKTDPAFDSANINFEIKGFGPVGIRADKVQLRQCLWNLVKNSYQALGETKNPKVILSIDQLSTATASYITLSITDNGPGIPLSDQASIFEPFVSLRKGGTGLGLAIVHRIVEQHGAQIRLHSEPGSGATFEILFPAQSKQEIEKMASS